MVIHFIKIAHHHVRAYGMVFANHTFHLNDWFGAVSFFNKMIYGIKEIFRHFRKQNFSRDYSLHTQSSTQRNLLSWTFYSILMLLKAPQKCFQIGAVYKMTAQHDWHSVWNGLNKNWTLGIFTFQFGAELLLHGVWQEHLVEMKALLGCP